VAIETEKLIEQLEGRIGERAGAQPRIAVVIPCYRERAHILEVLARIPPVVTQIVCVDDGCPDQSGAFVQEQSDDPRVTVIVNERNEGVGGATKRGYRAALEAEADVVVKLDGDGQMDPDLIPGLIAPILDGHADYTKGNRFFSLENTESMPRHRIIGNVIMSFVSKFSTGYWQVFDPNNGFTAIHGAALRLVPMSKISDGYFFESDMLFRLNTLRAVVVDIPMLAKYGEEESHLKVRRALPVFAARHAANFVKRIFYSYFLRGFSVASIQWILGPLLFVFGVCFGVYQWIAASAADTSATAGTVMLAALPVIVGLQFVLAAIDFDVRSVPTIPLHRLLGRPIGERSKAGG
jgi:dolichol-phosphate mannosyltransferase